MIAGELPTVRHAARVVLLDESDRVLLARFAPTLGMSTSEPMLSATVAREPLLGMPGIVGVMGFLNSLSSAATLALVLAVWFLIRPRPEESRVLVAAGDRDELFRRLSALRESSTYMRIFLYVGTAALVTGVLRMNATLSWMQSFLVPADEVILDGLRTTMVGVIGATYSLMLASMYLPAMLILRARASGLIGEAAVTPEVRAEARQEVDFSVSFKDVLPRILALLGPVLAGPAGEFLARLAGA